MATGSPKSRHPAPTIHEARLASGPSGAVEWESALTLEQAIARRRQELDIVVRGDDENANRKLAKTVEEAVGPASRPQPPHTSTAGPNALPHFHQISRWPAATLFTKPRNGKPGK